MKALYLPLVFLLACSLKSTPINEPPLIGGTGFSEYWYQGKAEITSYKLEQARYGEIHQGEAVLVFVTEDFSESKQVKLDFPQNNPEDAVKVLKLNYTKKFNTGVYPYSMMQSVFTPVDRDKYPKSLKLTTSSQEWCGHTFTQLNLKEDHYKVQAMSYFESEGDISNKVPRKLAEDEIWNLIRIDPSKLPLGNVELIPSLFFQRLSHNEIAVNKAIATLDQAGETSTYKLEYPTQKRKISIRFNTNAPYDILGWEESHMSGWGSGAKMLTTKATRINQIMSDYWNKNHVADVQLRKELGLD